MSADILLLGRGPLRATDGNTLLRLFDQAQEIRRSSSLKVERARADRALERIARELHRRNLATSPCQGEANNGGGGVAASPTP